MKRRSQTSSKKIELQKRAIKSKIARDLPLVHVAPVGTAAEIVDSKQFETRPCKVFKKNLVYFFVLRPAYKKSDGQDKSDQINRFPFVFIVSKGAVSDPHHVYPFDTGAAAAGLFAEQADPWVMLEDYELLPNHTAAEAHINWAFSDLQDYFDGSVKNNLVEKEPRYQDAVRSYYDIARMAAHGHNKPDKRSSAVEIASSKNIPLKGQVLLAILPRQFVEDQDDTNDGFINKLESLQIEYETYEWHPNSAPDDFQDEISQIALSFYKRKGIIV